MGVAIWPASRDSHAFRGDKMSGTSERVVRFAGNFFATAAAQLEVDLLVVLDLEEFSGWS